MHILTVKYFITVFIINSIYLEVAFCDSHDKCNFHKPDKIPHNFLSHMTGKTFHCKNGDVQYEVAICQDIPITKVNNGSVIARQNKPSESPTVLGRSNDTDVVAGENWMVITYGSGDLYEVNSTCLGDRKSRIFVICNPSNEKPILRFVDNDTAWKHECFSIFELQTQLVCPEHYNKGLSQGSVFCIILFTVAGMYLLVGCIYKRLVYGAKGFDQIPNSEFWAELGNLQADGCNYFCRRKRDDSWQRLTNNFSDHYDHDDSLLPP